MIDLGKLATQGRAFSGSRPWSPEELEALVTLERERKIGRSAAADYIRNGILTLEAYDKAVAAKFAPKTLQDAASEAESALKDNAFSAAAEDKAAAEAEEVKKAAEAKKSDKKK